MKKNPKDLSGISGKVKCMEMCSTLGELRNEKEAEQFVDKWRADFFKEVKDGFICSKVDEICETLLYFLLVGDESGTSMDPNGMYLYNYNNPIVITQSVFVFLFFKNKFVIVLL